MAPKTNKRKDTLIQQIMRREVEWGSAVNFLEEQYQTGDVDVLQFTYDTLLEHKARLDKLLDNISEFTLTTNENTTLAEHPGERTTTLLKWKKIKNGLSKPKMDPVGASGDNPITKTTLYAPSYQTDTQGTIKLQPKITRRYNLRNRHNSSNNSRESSSDRSLRNAISISQPQDSCPTLTERNNTSCSVSNEIRLSIDRYQSLNFRIDTNNSSPDSQQKNGRDAVVSNKSCKRNVGQTVENTANNSTGISNQRIDWDRNSLQQGSSRTFVEQTSNSEPKDSNEGNERQTELSKRTQGNQHNERIGTNWNNQFTEPFQFVKSNKNNQNPQTTSTVNNSAKFKSFQLPDKQLKNSKVLIAQKVITYCPSEDSCDNSDSDSDKGTNQRNDSRAKVSSKNQASKLQIIGGSTTHQQRTQQENCLTNSRILASYKQKQTSDRNIFSSSKSTSLQ